MFKLQKNYSQISDFRKNNEKVDKSYLNCGLFVNFRGLSGEILTLRPPNEILRNVEGGGVEFNNNDLHR